MLLVLICIFFHSFIRSYWDGVLGGDSDEEDREAISIRPTKKSFYDSYGHKKKKKRVYNKKHACYYCDKMVAKICQHLETCHKDKQTVMKIILLKPTENDVELVKKKKLAQRKIQWELL